MLLLRALHFIPRELNRPEESARKNLSHGSLSHFLSMTWSITTARGSSVVTSPGQALGG